MRKKIEITDELLDAAECSSPSNCAVAMAINAVIDSQHYYATVTGPHYRIWDRATGEAIGRKLPTSDEVSAFVVQFDTWNKSPNMKRPTPQSFEIDIPGTFLKLAV